MSAADANERPVRHALLSAVGTATGVVAFVYFVGGAIVWERLHVLELPATQGLEPLPRELLLVVGARALAWPLTLGVLAIVAVHALWRLPSPTTRGRAGAGYLGLIFLFTEVQTLAAVFASVQQAIFVGAFGVLVAGGVVLVRAGRATLRQASFGLFVSLALVGAVVEAIDIYRLPVHLERANVFLSDGKEVNGFFIGETADTVYIARNNGHHVCGWITALPRRDISRLAVFSPSAARPPKAPAHLVPTGCPSSARPTR